MNDSLSIVVPVRNAEATLAGQVARLLEVLPDLAQRFEIVLVDDASTDQTVELACELAAQFPQLRLVRHRDPRGVQAAVRTGLQWASGRTVLVPEDPATLSARELRLLWSRRNDEELVVARTGAAPRVFDQQLLERLAAWGRQLATAERAREAPHNEGGLHMLRRDAALRLLADEADDNESSGAPAPLHTRADASHEAALPRRATTFLRHLRKLALGE